MPPFPRFSEDIIERARRGDIAVFEMILFAYERHIFTYVSRLVGNTQNAEDITQETFIKLYTHLSSLDSGKNIKSFLFTIATNTAYDWLRRMQKQPEILPLDDYEVPAETIHDDSSYYNAGQLVYLEPALEKIKPLQKAVLLLFYREELSYQEIADTLVLPLNTVKTHLRRAKQALHKELLNLSSHL